MIHKLAAAITVLLRVSLLVAGCTSSTNRNQAASASQSSSSAATAANTITKAASASVISPTPTPKPTPTPQCNHVDIVVYHPVDAQGQTLPCMMCTSRFASYTEYADQHKPYVTVTSQGMLNSSWGEYTTRVTATVRGTEVSQNYDAYNENQLEVWVDSVLTCK